MCEMAKFCSTSAFLLFFKVVQVGHMNNNEYTHAFGIFLLLGGSMIASRRFREQTKLAILQELPRISRIYSGITFVFRDAAHLRNTQHPETEKTEEARGPPVDAAPIAEVEIVGGDHSVGEAHGIQWFHASRMDPPSNGIVLHRRVFAICW